MVRTKDCSGVKVSNKAHRKVSSTTAMESTSGKHSEKSSGGGNPIHPRETPSWQKEITNFFPKNSNGETNQPSSSSANLECNTDVEQIQHQEVKEKTVKEVLMVTEDSDITLNTADNLQVMEGEKAEVNEGEIVEEGVNKNKTEEGNIARDINNTVDVGIKDQQKTDDNPMSDEISNSKDNQDESPSKNKSNLNVNSDEESNSSASTYQSSKLKNKRKLNVNSDEESNSPASTYQSSVDDCHSTSSKDGSRAKNKKFKLEVESVSSGEDCQLVSVSPKDMTAARVFSKMFKMKKRSVNKRIPVVLDCIDITSTSDEDED